MTNKNIETLFTDHEYLIGNTIRRNRPLLAALRLDDEDVKQDLSIAMLSAIEIFNPKLSESLVVHVKCRLQYEILKMKRDYKPHGITGVPKGERIESLYLDSTQLDGSIYEISSYDDVGEFEHSELFDSLSDDEPESLELKINGFYLRSTAQNTALSQVRRKYTGIYENEGRFAA